MTFLFYGPDTFRSWQALGDRRRDFRKAHSAVEEYIIDGREKNVDPRGILGQFFSPSLFSLPKLLVVKYPDEGEKWQEFWRIAAGAELQGDTGRLVLAWMETVSKELLKRFSQKSIFFFDKLEGRELRAWLREESERLSVQLDTPAEALILETYRGDLEGLSHELEKLANVKPGQILGTEELVSTASFAKPIAVFPLFDAIGARSRPDCLGALTSLLMQGEPANELYAAVTGFFRNLLVVKLARTKKDIDRAFSGRHPFWVSRLQAAAENFSAKELAALFRQGFQGEYKFKTGRAEPQPMLEELILAATRR